MYFNHNWAVTLNTFNQNQRLKSFWNVIASSTTPYNEDFVAVMEAKDYPFFGVQFHPEKNLYEWKVFADRSAEGSEVVQIMSNRYIDYARKNSNRFENAKEFTDKSIYNYKTQQSTKYSFTEIYVFNETPRLRRPWLKHD